MYSMKSFDSQPQNTLRNILRFQAHGNAIMLTMLQSSYTFNQECLLLYQLWELYCDSHS